jgi:hypothetical protein
LTTVFALSGLPSRIVVRSMTHAGLHQRGGLRRLYRDVVIAAHAHGTAGLHAVAHPPSGVYVVIHPPEIVGRAEHSDACRVVCHTWYRSGAGRTNQNRDPDGHRESGHAGRDGNGDSSSRRRLVDRLSLYRPLLDRSFALAVLITS